MNTFTEHPMSAIFPEMPEGDFRNLVADIRTHGVREPIWLYEGKILDGRNRYRACQEAGQKCPSREFKGSRQDALALVWSMNRERRHLNPGQVAVADSKRAQFVAEYAAEIERLKAEAAEKKKASGKEGGRGKKKNLSQNFGQGLSPHQRRSLEKRAKAAGTNRTYIEFADRLVKEHPEKAEEVLRGEKPIYKAMQEVKAEQQKSVPPPPPSPKAPEPTGPSTGPYMPNGRPPRIPGQIFAEEGKLVDAAIANIKAACKAIQKCHVKYGFGDKSLEDLRTVYEELGHIVKGAK